MPLLSAIKANISQITVVGESAGGHLAISALLDVKDTESIQKLVLIYPEISYTDESSKMQSEIQHANVSGVLTAKQDDWFWQLYLGPHIKHASVDYYVNLLAIPDKMLKKSFGKMKILVLLARYDVLYSEGKEFAEMVSNQGMADVQIVEYDTIHGFYGENLFFAARSCREEIVRFIAL